MALQKKKSLGQHFLKSASYVRSIADAAEIQAGERVLEIGPGEGVLTKELLARGAHVVAVEKDHRLIPILEVTFTKEISEGRLEVVEGDALEIDAETLMRKGPYKLVANIPYYITGVLFKKFLSGVHQPNTLVFLIQKEVAQRITGHPSTGSGSQKESILSLSVKAYGDVKYVKTVPAGAFSPPPDVDSAILAVRNISKKNFENAAHEARFFEVVRAGFAQKRKLLKRNLEPVLGTSVAERFTDVDIPDTARAEDIPLEAWLKLSA
ncbi:MAG TPA: 16S rRNA (adenine(1518)-N(6)/adenine(1519)-N(6))-dimethyltransferase RsmA [Candidatus Paceibacterota bacterium]|nr:16S rRNA (adenine(1518)-N(6)/adenine(1519)-N(6))-dimethyltransferase RsmA [Candidatus Paceibacterota bacterium]